MPMSCFTAAGGDPSQAASSSPTTVYWTHLGAITLTWSRATLGPLGLVLAAELTFAGDAAPTRFLLRPWILWRRRGSRCFSASGHAVAFSWDLSRARMAERQPEPLSGYFLRVSIDGELALAAGDLATPPASAGLVLARRETAVCAGRGDTFTTSVGVAGKKHEVSLGVEEAGMWVAVNGEKAPQVRCLQLNFRGSERLNEPRVRVLVTWDLHGWLYAPDAAAVFVFRFEAINANHMDAGTVQSSSRNHRDERWCSSDMEMRGRMRGPVRSVATVAEWITTAALQDVGDGGGSSLVVYLRKPMR